MRTKKAMTMKQEQIQAIADNHIRTMLNNLEADWATDTTTSDKATDSVLRVVELLDADDFVLAMSHPDGYFR